MAEMTAWTVETVRPGGAPGTMAHQVRAVYMTTEHGGQPDELSWVIFRDANHDIVAQFSAVFVVSVHRDTPTGQDRTDEERIRDAMAEAQDHPGRVITR